MNTRAIGAVNQPDDQRVTAPADGQGVTYLARPAVAVVRRGVRQAASSAT